MNTLFISMPSVQAVRFSDKPFFANVTAQIMKTVAITTVKDQLSAYVREAQTSPVINTKNGKHIAMLTGIRNEDDLDSLLLANNPRFLQILEEARQRGLLIAGALFFGALAFYDPLQIAMNLPDSGDIVQQLIGLGLIRSGDELIWLALRLALEIMVGLAMFICAGLLLFKDDRHGLLVGSVSILFYLLSVNLLVLYFNQFTYILLTVLEFGFFLGLMRYRRRFLLPREAAPLGHL